MAVVKPTPQEEALIKERLKKKYPQMSGEGGWAVAKAIKDARTKATETGSSGTRTAFGSMDQSTYDDIRKRIPK